MYDEDREPPLGIVPLEGRGSLPFALVHGESLVAAASWALTSAGAELFDYNVPLSVLQDSGRPLVVHDPLCPMTPVDFLTEAIEESERTGAVVVGVRPVTDTVKQYAEGGEPRRLGATVDRETLMCVVSPVVLPAAVLATLESLPVEDLAELVALLVRRVPVRHLPAPALARRVTDTDDLAVLAALSSSAHP
jgi:2-C-methyl-D-erythritol 4-phosphate cytidylyltransferase